MEEQDMEHFDELETREPEVRERDLFSALRRQIAHAKLFPYFSRLLRHVDASAVVSRDILAALPITRKSDLAAIQQSARPFGGVAAADWSQIRRVFASPGGIYEPEGADLDYWRFARALFAARFRAGDLVHNAFSYHLTPAGGMLERGAHALGCAVIPAGVGQTELQVRAMVDLGADAYTGTPSFLRTILNKADELGVALPRLRKALVSAEAFPHALRQELAARGVTAYEAYASADLGCIAYESNVRDGLMVDEGVLVEILRPDTGEPAIFGEVGEVVVTPLANRTYPLIRFATGDLSAFLPGESACGRTNLRIRGWLGRVDQSTKVRGLFLHPSHVATILERHPAIARSRLVVDTVDNSDSVTLHVESENLSPAEVHAIVTTLRELTKLRAEIAVHAPGALPIDGKVIDDRRKLYTDVH